jgi:hypothetical protein
MQENLDDMRLVRRPLALCASRRFERKLRLNSTVKSSALNNSLRPACCDILSGHKTRQRCMSVIMSLCELMSLFCTRTQSMICVEHYTFIQGVRCFCVRLFMLAVLMQTAVLLLVGIKEG